MQSGVNPVPGRRDRSGDEEESLAALRRTWGDAYLIPAPRRRGILAREWLARRKGTARVLSGRDAGMLGLAIAEDWAAIPPQDRSAYRAGAR